MQVTDLREWQNSARTFDFNGEKFCYWTSSDSADKPTLLLIHGFPSASWDWSPVWNTLAQHYQLVAVDMLGFGFSSKNPKADYSIHCQANLQQALLQHLAITEYSVLAHNYGDTVAQELLARDQNNHRIQQMFLLNGGLFPETHRALFVQKLMLSPVGFLIPLVINKKRFLRSFAKICAKPLSIEEMDGLWQLMAYNQGPVVMPKLIHYIKERREHRERWVGALTNSRTPLVLINGSDDPISGSHMVERYRQLVQTDHIYELPGIGHYPQLEDPASVSRLILQTSSVL